MFTKKLTVYPSYGYQEQADPETWIIPVRAWVRNKQPMPPDGLIRVAVDEEGALTERELLRLKNALEDFVALDNEGEKVSLVFDGDPDSETFELVNASDDNGLVEEDFKLTAAKVRKIIGARREASVEPGWLTFTARTSGWTGAAESRGRVRLLESEGLSVVSDIDDTVKVSEITAGKRRVFKRTFLMEYEAAEGMRDRYLKTLERHPHFNNISFHYVSGSPWQLFRLLHEFLVESVGYPPGTFHMKTLHFNYEDLVATFRGLRNFLAGAAYTEQQKTAQISELMLRMPERRFILVGDSGERDPEIYRAIKTRFGEQVEKIYIRDVSGLGEGAERLAGMCRLDLKGVCLLDEVVAEGRADET